MAAVAKVVVRARRMIAVTASRRLMSQKARGDLIFSFLKDSLMSYSLVMFICIYSRIYD